MCCHLVGPQEGADGACAGWMIDHSMSVQRYHLTARTPVRWANVTR